MGLTLSTMVVELTGNECQAAVNSNAFSLAATDVVQEEKVSMVVELTGNECQAAVNSNAFSLAATDVVQDENVSPVFDIFVTSFVLHRQPGDNSCLYHALSRSFNHCFSCSDYESTSLRININNFIFSHDTSHIFLGPSYEITIVAAIAQGLDCTVLIWQIGRAHV